MILWDRTTRVCRIRNSHYRSTTTCTGVASNLSNKPVLVVLVKGRVEWSKKHVALSTVVRISVRTTTGTRIKLTGQQLGT